MIDTCQANTMYTKFYSPNILATGSSEISQSSYSHHADSDVGVAVIDRYTYYNLDFLETHVQSPSSKTTLGQLFDSYDPKKMHSDAGVRYDLFKGGEEGARGRLLMDFFGNVQNVEVDESAVGDMGNETEWREDLLALGRKIAELKVREGVELDEDDKSHLAQNKNSKTKENSNLTTRSGTTNTENTKSNIPIRKIGAQKVVTDQEGWWGKKAVGAAALAGCMGVWALGSWLEGGGGLVGSGA